jgi:hypothetical protein
VLADAKNGRHLASDSGIRTIHGYPLTSWLYYLTAAMAPTVKRPFIGIDCTIENAWEWHAQRLERLFNPATTASLQKGAVKDADVFRVQQIHQKIETGQIRELEVDSNTALVSVERQILRTGVFNQRVVNDVKKLTVFLRRLRTKRRVRSSLMAELQLSRLPTKFTRSNCSIACDQFLGMQRSRSMLWSKAISMAAARTFQSRTSFGSFCRRPMGWRQSGMWRTGVRR